MFLNMFRQAIIFPLGDGVSGSAWVLFAAIGVLAAILGFVIKIVTDQVIKKLDEIVSELKQLTRTSAVQEQQIKELQEQDKTLHHRLNDHASRIRAIEIKFNKD
jgi:septal ring factor EnvC (AmiA/AmiB activator)